MTEVDGSDKEDDAISLHDSSDDESNDAVCLICACIQKTNMVNSGNSV